MTKNMGGIDRAVRVLIAISLAALLSTGAFSGTLALVLTIVAVVLFLTALVGWCPLYAPLGLSTKRRAGDTG
ncbi:MAG: DUF2892 domain-containing protein [Gemmatimonas sp.]|nr:DUF2892 domain-containing protein [Gemmatimonas sp.]